MNKAQGELHRVGSVDEFALGEFKVFMIGNRPIGVVRTERGFFAVRNRCPHQGAAICAGRVTGTMLPSLPHEYRFDAEAQIVICPWHRWEFDLQDGTAVGAITKKKLVTYEVEVDGNDVYLRLRAKKTNAVVGVGDGSGGERR